MAALPGRDLQAYVLTSGPFDPRQKKKSIKLGFWQVQGKVDLLQKTKGENSSLEVGLC